MSRVIITSGVSLTVFSSVAAVVGMASCANPSEPNRSLDDSFRASDVGSAEAAPQGHDMSISGAGPKWDPVAIASEALRSHNRYFEADANAKFHLLEWQEGVIRDELLLESAILGEIQGGQLILYHCYRHPDLQRPAPKWRLFTVVGAPFINQRSHQIPVEHHAYLQFLKDADFPVPAQADYEQVDGGKDFISLIQQ